MHTKRVPVSTFYYHVRALRKKACILLEPAGAVAQKQEVVQISVRKTEAQTLDSVSLTIPLVWLEGGPVLKTKSRPGRYDSQCFTCPVAAWLAGLL